MDYNKYFDKFKNMTAIEIKKRITVLTKYINEADNALYFNGGLNRAAALEIIAALFIDGNVTIEKKMFYNYLAGLYDYENIQSQESIVKIVLGRGAEYINLMGLLKDVVKTFNKEELFTCYKNVTDNLRVDNILAELICACLTLNSPITEEGMALFNFIFEDGDPTDFIGVSTSKHKIEEVKTYETVQSNYSVKDEMIVEYDEGKDPKVINMGASVYTTTWNSYYFSIGAEIAVYRNERSLEIEIELLDEDGYVIDTISDTPGCVDHGMFYYGYEQEIMVVPDSYRIKIKTDNYDSKSLDLNHKINVYNVEFMEDYDYDNRYRLFAIIENIGYRTNDLDLQVYFTFYDSNDKIIGGLCISASTILYRLPDRYNQKIFCENVRTKTKKYKYTVTLY